MSKNHAINIKIKCIYILLILLIGISSQARQARCVGKFTLKNIPLPASMDIYSILVNYHKEEEISVTLTVTPSFNASEILRYGAKIIKKDRNEIFILCKRDSLTKIASLPTVLHCYVSRKPFPLMDSVRSLCRINQVHGTVASPLPTPYKGKGVLAGILDTEFDITHPAFLDENGKTRFIALWDQEDTTKSNNRFGYGIIKRGEELLSDSLFGLKGPGSFHGTHTASTMAGSDRRYKYYGVAPAAKLIGVIYKGEKEIADGLRWISSVADSLKLPCVINMSIGFAEGPHDGTSLVDRVIDSISGKGKIVVGAAGNDGSRFVHIKFELNRGETKGTFLMPLKEAPPGKTPIFYSGADFWGEEGKPFSGKFLIINKKTLEYIESGKSFNTSTTRVYKEEPILWKDPQTGEYDTFFIQYGTERASSLNNKPHLLFYGKTKREDLWLGVTITNPSNNTSTVIHGWNIAKKMFDGFGLDGFYMGDSLYTVNEVGGTAKRIITVGAYNGRAFVPLWNGGIFEHPCRIGEAFGSSSCGPTVDGRLKPDITAPGWSVIAALSRTANRDYEELAVWPDTTNTLGRYGGSTGTSMAAPVVAGIVALMLEANPKLTPEEAKNILAKTAIKDSFTGPLLEPSYKWGYGKVNAEGAIAQILGITEKNKRNFYLEERNTIVIYNKNILTLHFSYKFPVEEIEIYDIKGKLIIKEKVVNKAFVKLRINLSAGRYLLKMKGLTIPKNIPFLVTRS